MKLFSLIRYRFFLYAGLLPYLLGAAWAFGATGVFRPGVFWLGLLGIGLSIVGVESFNEYFDARLGTDRIFNLDQGKNISNWALYFGWAAFALAAVVGLYLAKEAGWPIIVYMLLGGLAAIFYIAPPVRWVYLGLGELMIGLAYGPWMTLGALHLQTRQFSNGALLASLAPGLLIMALAVVNAIPDYYQDRLVGKRNLVVRLGRRRAVWLYLALSAAGLMIPIWGVYLGLFPTAVWLTLPAWLFWLASARLAVKTYDEPLKFIPAVRQIVICYVVATGAFILACLKHRC